MCGRPGVEIYVCYFLTQLRRVRQGEVENFEVHHLKERLSSCRLTDLAVVSLVLHAKLHRGEVRSLPMPSGGQPVVAGTPR